MFFKLLDDDYSFPSAELAEPEGLLAMGGDLSPMRLLNAYANGIFPWYNEGEPILWWSLDPRLVIRPGEMKVSKSLRHVINAGKFEVRIDTAFRSVMQHCAATPREGQDGTWISNDILEAYCKLHELGFAHSFETWLDGQLVGGLYGVAIGQAFFGESMFHTVSDASKVALVHLAAFLQKSGGGLIDCQIFNPHLASLGAHNISRSDYLRRLRALGITPGVVQKPVPLCTP